MTYNQRARVWVWVSVFALCEYGFSVRVCACSFEFSGCSMCVLSALFFVCVLGTCARACGIGVWAHIRESLIRTRPVGEVFRVFLVADGVFSGDEVSRRFPRIFAIGVVEVVLGIVAPPSTASPTFFFRRFLGALLWTTATTASGGRRGRKKGVRVVKRHLWVCLCVCTCICLCATVSVYV